MTRTRPTVNTFIYLSVWPAWTASVYKKQKTSHYGIFKIWILKQLDGDSKIVMKSHKRSRKSPAFYSIFSIICFSIALFDERFWAATMLPKFEYENWTEQCEDAMLSCGGLWFFPTDSRLLVLERPSSGGDETSLRQRRRDHALSRCEFAIYKATDKNITCLQYPII